MTDVPLRRASRVVRVPARPAPLDVDLARAAVLVLDMQNDHAAKGGMLARAGVDVEPVRRALAPTRRVLDAARAAGVPVVYLKTGYRPDLSDLGPEGAPIRARLLRMGAGQIVLAPDGRPSQTLVRDTWSTEVVPELAPQPGDVVLWKTRPSGFFGTDLQATLRRLDVTHLVVTGCTTSGSVESTLRDAAALDHACLLLADCAGEPVGEAHLRTNHEATLLAVESYLGWVGDADGFVGALRARVPVRGAA